MLSDGEIQRITDAIQSGAISNRDAAIVLFGLTTGIRAIDLINLRLSDIDWDNETISFKQSKTGNYVFLPLPVSLGNAIIRYLSEERPDAKNDYLFVRAIAPFEPLAGHTSCYAIVRSVFKTAEIRKDARIFGMHMLRHNAASTMVKNEVPISTIAAILGHADIDTTDIYITTDEKKLRECVLPMTGISGGVLMRDFVSNLADKLDNFLDYKHALGIKYDTCCVYLLELDGYNLEHGNHDTLTKEMTEGWAIWHAGKSESQDRSWIPPIREFGRYLQSIGEKDAYVLDDRFSIQRYHAEVYLMSTDEIQAFFRECDSYVLRAKVPGRPYVLPALYRFLYCCGVRCIEARKLKCINVHLENGYVDILDTKSHKDRRLYLSEELISYLDQYDKAVSAYFPEREYFFPGAKGDICSTTVVSANFRKIWVSAGLKRDGKVKPRAYDFRHHFACANIMRWSQEGKDVHAMLPYLMRYMGHSSLESTYYYIHLIPDYFSQYAKLTSSTEDLIPEVEVYEV